ncbi:MAG: hypothetical protein HY905_21420 [Deltaproteobacteria bacterium]|nr:hypothetical protein [Deltaproteobacteria bacterium]
MLDADRTQLERRVAELERELAEAAASLPRHSVRPHQLQRVEELQERLVEARMALDRAREGDGGS